MFATPPDDPTTYYAFGEFQNKLCRFDSEKMHCFGPELQVKANAGPASRVRKILRGACGCGAACSQRTPWVIRRREHRPTRRAGTIGGINYYYSKNLGDDDDAVYVVEGVNGDYPTFHDETRFSLSYDLFSGGVLDLAAVAETDGVPRVEDETTEGLYLLGLAEDFSVLIAREPSGIKCSITTGFETDDASMRGLLGRRSGRDADLPRAPPPQRPVVVFP